MNPQTLRATTSARSLTALASLLLTVGLLAGCAGADETPAAVPGVSSSASASDDAADGSADAAEFSYEGVAGQTALALLLEADPSAVVSGEGENAFVTGIEGRDAQESAQEFWEIGRAHV